MSAIAMNAVNPFAQAKSMADASAGNSSGQSSNITANDFLTLLVTEMKNQDPTAQTDPNEYINQLVQVNSLQQLIEINQNLSSAIGTSGSSAAYAAGTPYAQVTTTAGPDASASVAGSSTIQTANLSADPAAAAQRLANALSGSR